MKEKLLIFLFVCLITNNAESLEDCYKKGFQCLDVNMAWVCNNTNNSVTLTKCPENTFCISCDGEEPCHSPEEVLDFCPDYGFACINRTTYIKCKTVEDISNVLKCPPTYMCSDNTSDPCVPSSLSQGLTPDVALNNRLNKIFTSSQSGITKPKRKIKGSSTEKPKKSKKPNSIKDVSEKPKKTKKSNNKKNENENLSDLKDNNNKKTEEKLEKYKDYESEETTVDINLSQEDEGEIEANSDEDKGNDESATKDENKNKDDQLSTTRRFWKFALRTLIPSFMTGFKRLVSLFFIRYVAGYALRKLKTFLRWYSRRGRFLKWKRQ